MEQMKTMLTKHLNEKRLHVERAFNAPLAVVWKAWTDSNILDKWWAPKPWKAETKSMDFREGGVWYYSMVGPEGERHHCRADYEKIEPMKSYTGFDAFCDEKGNINYEFPRMRWNTRFTEQNGTTLVTIDLTFEKEEDLVKIMEMGFQEGFTMAHGNLDELLESELVK